MKRLHLVFIFAALLLFPAFGVDFGGYLDNITGVSTGDNGFLQSDRLSLWFGTELGASLGFAVGGSYTFSTLYPMHIIDLDYLSLEGTFRNMEKGPSLFRVTLGRFPFQDFSGEVLTHSLDGMALGFEFSSLTAAVTLGYTGLHMKPASSIILSRADLADRDEDDVFFAAPRLVGALQLELASLFLDQDLTVSLFFQDDLREQETLVEEGEQQFSPDNGGKMDTQYIGGGVNGRIVPGMYHNTFFMIGTGRTLSYIADENSETGASYSYQPVLSYLFGIELNYYMEQIMFSRAGARLLFASGDADQYSTLEGNTAGKATAFIPVTPAGMGLVFVPNLTNLVAGEASYSLRPLSGSGSPIFSSLQTILKGILFFRSSTGAITESGVDPESDASYLGTEIDGIVNLQPFSDLGASLSFGLFMPSSNAFLARETEFLGRLTFSLSF